MPISVSRLREAGQFQVNQRAATLNEARRYGFKTAFLCHSHRDQTLVKGLVRLLQNQGWNIYIDWQDTSMPETPDRETARRIKEKIEQVNFFLFLATENSMASRWCPWEIGYADGKKPIDSILIIPTRDDGGTSRGNEYLQLYRRIDVADNGKLGAWAPGEQRGILVEDL